MTNAVIKKYDELIRNTNVLSESIEQEVKKFISHQEIAQKSWKETNAENHDTKKYLAKYQADKDSLEVKLKMARSQLDKEQKKRLKAEQSVDHLTRQLELIKELLLEKNGDKTMLAQTLSHHHVNMSDTNMTGYSSKDESGLSHRASSHRGSSHCGSRHHGLGVTRESDMLSISSDCSSVNDVMLRTPRSPRSSRSPR